MENITAELKKANLNIKTLIDWDDNERVQQLTLYLRQIQSDLEVKMHQSIQSHILGKQKLINTLHDALPALQRHKTSEINVDEQLNPLIEMLQVREKIDFALDAIEGVINTQENQQNA